MRQDSVNAQHNAHLAYIKACMPEFELVEIWEQKKDVVKIILIKGAINHKFPLSLRFIIFWSSFVDWLILRLLVFLLFFFDRNFWSGGSHYQ